MSTKNLLLKKYKKIKHVRDNFLMMQKPFINNIRIKNIQNNAQDNDNNLYIIYDLPYFIECVILRNAKGYECNPISKESECGCYDIDDDETIENFHDDYVSIMRRHKYIAFNGNALIVSFYNEYQYIPLLLDLLELCENYDLLISYSHVYFKSYF